jgi:hypothetical protein
MYLTSDPVTEQLGQYRATNVLRIVRSNQGGRQPAENVTSRESITISAGEVTTFTQGQNTTSAVSMDGDKEISRAKDQDDVLGSTSALDTKPRPYFTLTTGRCSVGRSPSAKNLPCQCAGSEARPWPHVGAIRWIKSERLVRRVINLIIVALSDPSTYSTEDGRFRM